MPPLAPGDIQKLLIKCNYIIFAVISKRVKFEKLQTSSLMLPESLMLEVSHHKIGLCTPREALVKVTAISKHTQQ